MQSTFSHSLSLVMPNAAATQAVAVGGSSIRCDRGRRTSKRIGGEVRMGEVEDDFEVFYRVEFPAMVALAHTICGDSQLAEDLAQEAMTRAHHRWDQLVDYDKPGAWLRRVTINLALTRRRRRMREVVGLGRHKLETISAPESPTQDAAVWEAVATLAPKQRAAIALFYQEDASTAQIAEFLDCTVSTATSHLSQARRKLADLLDQVRTDEDGYPIDGNPNEGHPIEGTEPDNGL